MCTTGRRPLQSVLVRLRDRCQAAGGSPLGAKGATVVTLAAKTVETLYEHLHDSNPSSPALSSMAEFGCLLLVTLLHLFAPPPRPAGACCACPGGPSARASDAPVRARVGVVLGTPFVVYGRSFSYTGPMAAVHAVAEVCYNAAAWGVDTKGALVAAGWRQLCSMVLARGVYAARQSGHRRAFGGAGAADLARFVDPALLTAPTAAVVVTSDDAAHVHGAALALGARHAPACGACLPDQLMLVLEAAGLLDEPEKAARCYQELRDVMMQALGGLSRPGEDAAAAGPQRGFWRRAWPRLAARALEAALTAGQVPAGSAHASHQAMVLRALSAMLSFCVMVGWQPDDGAELDAICEAVARTRLPLMCEPACILFRLRLQCVLLSSPSGAPPRAVPLDASPPRTLAAAVVSMGKLMQFNGAAEAARVATLLDRLSDEHVAAQQLVAAAMFTCNGGNSEPPAPGFAAGPAASVDGGSQLWVQLTVLVAARVEGAVARQVLLEGGQALLPSNVRQHVTRAAAQLLQRPLLWDAVQRSTHGRVAPVDIGPEPGGQAAVGAGAARTNTQNRDSGGGTSASACTAALRFLAELHDWLDPHALGVRLPGCYNPRCADMSGASEADLLVRTCSQCLVARYCSAACAKQHWRWHKAACLLAAAQVPRADDADQRAAGL